MPKVDKRSAFCCVLKRITALASLQIVGGQLMSTTMAKTTASSANPEEKMAPPSVSLLEKKSPTNGHSSPVRTGKTTSSNIEKKPQINGHASPLHVQVNSSNKAVLEGYMKTDDRVRLAKERREERERSLAAREQMIKEKERRAQLQYERTLEERCRRLEEQRLREEQRRVAVEEKRRQQLEEERERLEARMKRSLERSRQLEQRSRRWGRGYPGAAPCSPHRSPYRMDHSRVVLQGGSQSTPNTPKKQRLQKYRNASPGYSSPLRRSESPAAVKNIASPTSKVVSQMRTHSPNNLQQNQNSPVRQNANISKGVKKAEEVKEKHTKLSKSESPQKSVQAERSSTDPKTKGVPPQGIKVNMTEKFHSPERRNKGAQPNVQEADKNKDTVSSAFSGKVAAGTTNEEEATRLLAERRRLARALKDQEEKKRAQEQEEKKRAQEQEEKKRAQEQEKNRAQEQEEKKRAQEEQERLKKEPVKKPIPQQQEAKVEVQKEEIKKVENLKNESVNQTNGENEQLIQNGKEEKAKMLTPEEARRQQQERDLQKQQEEEERQLRKKRIEEIMKRTRKGEGDLKVEESAWADTGEIPVSVDGKEMAQTDQKVEVQTKSENKTVVNISVKQEALNTDPKENPKRETIQKVDIQKPEETQKSNDNKNCTPKNDVDQCKQSNANIKMANQINKAVKRESTGELVKRVVKSETNYVTTEVSRQQSLHVSKADVTGVTQNQVTKPSVTPLPLGQLTPPVIKLAPLDVSAASSGDEVQSMEVSPVSKEELISIPEFSPVIDGPNSGLSNSKALEDLMDLTGSVNPRLSPQNHIGDCNQNLIQGVVSPISDSKLIRKSPPSPNKLTVK
ncbi:MAP7 domain-containing protein 2a isoform X2 [Boleophthalmus pectinirostris]|uniref:MAP7 domain-containing protein 2a isoform X2 n=1 Tax=Boleophthalmus pectinirostris TaxID=150288 RepID=UPI00242E8CE2|nr:MAP7 domain-containing protein 2a isoform X2 [Boleophthalmus pectinirostris]